MEVFSVADLRGKLATCRSGERWLGVLRSRPRLCGDAAAGGRLAGPASWHDSTEADSLSRLIAVASKYPLPKAPKSLYTPPVPGLLRGISSETVGGSQ